MVIPKELFIEFTQEVLPHGPPVPIWIDIRFGRDSERGSSGFTTGLVALGHKEFETWGAPEPPQDLAKRLLALAGYVLEKGPVIRNGDTIGEDENEKIRIVFSDSLLARRPSDATSLRNSFNEEALVEALVSRANCPQRSVVSRSLTIRTFLITCSLTV